ncbi:hypothetical protein [Paenibacillus mendelii]|uniref:Uncharacterized protein n=1 Tax=Paenibacillus mendelii TaxID=206163 RepID=A0ABV6J620_9BACL|nr:hypothetical protein [Paenibacillus mendelii]MCQ6559963.1 hypothetical protein [Paenibacillus mendelii]
MATSRNHQGAHGIGQVEEQLKQQANAMDTIQGVSETDREIAKVANRDAQTSLDKIIDSKDRGV